MINSTKIRNDFPVFAAQTDLVYLDSPASTLTPKPVIDALGEYYETYPANVARGLYSLSGRATQEFEETRQSAARFLGADTQEIIFVRNTTEAINNIARALLENGISGEVAVTAMEHHANFVPWQQLTKKYNIPFRVIPLDDNYSLTPEHIATHITPKTKILAFVHISNVLGTINPAKEIIAAAREINPDIITVVDAAQSGATLPIDVRDMDCDFLACSGHKMFGPKGIGLLYGKKARLKNLPPFLYGGEMVANVTDADATFKLPPHRFEAGTPSIADAIAFKQSLAYIENLGREAIFEHERSLALLAEEKLRESFGDDISFFAPTHSATRSGIVSFSLCGVHPHDASQILADKNVCVRAGAHCALPLHHAMHTPATLRAGFSIYNDASDIDRLIKGLKKAQSLLKLH